MRIQFLLASFAAVAVTAAAQQPQATNSIAPAQQPAPSVGVAGTEGLAPPALDPLTLSILQSAACPVGMKASFNSRSQMVKVGKPDPPNAQPAPVPKPSQHVQLILGIPDKNPIVSVRVTAYGLTARRRLDRSSDPMVKGPSDIRRTMDITQFFTSRDGSLSADLVLPGFTAVKTVKLDSISYADGSIRQFSGESVCRVPVNPLMLVADR